jgi:4-amino-4-deoxy-L-arabinose transferase-like glycosyltransferase
MYGVITREMIKNGEWLYLTYEGQPYLNKPPLHFWLMGISSFLFGQTEFGLRFPTAAAAMGTMLIVYYFGKILYNRRTGFIAALIMATNYVFVWYSKRALLDTELAFFVTLTLLFFYLAYRNQDKKSIYLILAFISSALGTMIK